MEIDIKQLMEKYSHIDIENEKVHRIIDVAYKEFSENDFKKASTNNIVKMAGVSRGLLYHYFKDKEELYEFLIINGIDRMYDSIKKNVDFESNDFLELIKSAAISKYEVSREFDFVTEFLLKIQKEDEEKYTEYKNQVKKLYSDISYEEMTKKFDESLFKEGMDPKYVIDTIRWSIEGLFQSLKPKMESSKKLVWDEYIKALDDYIEFLRNVFYK